MINPVIVSAVRTPVGKAKKGALANCRPDDLASIVIKGVLAKAPRLTIDDIVFGCAMPEGESGLNVANIAKFIACLPDSVPAMTINRFCSSGLQSIASANDSIAVGRNEVVIAGGTESMSMVPMGGNKIAPNPDLVDKKPGAYITMGLTAERVAEKYKISRKDQDEFSYRSHIKAIKAIRDKKYENEIIPVKYENVFIGQAGKKQKQRVVLDHDEGPRSDTSIAALSELKPAFKQNGTVTAGNSSQVSDGAACVLLMSEEKAKALKIKPLARLIGYSVAGVEPELMGIGPIKAIPKILKLTGLDIKDIRLIELNEAFASQSLAVIRELKLDPSIINVNGGAIALGHPLGATGSILTVKIIHEMKRRKIRYGIVSMCVGGGMGAAGVIEAFI